MKINDFIAKLQAIEKEYGNIDIMITRPPVDPEWDDNDYFKQLVKGDYDGENRKKGKEKR